MKKYYNSLIARFVVAILLAFAIAGAGIAMPWAQPAQAEAQAAAYTVEFTRGDLQYVMPGGSGAPLSQVLSAVGLKGAITSARSSDSALFSVRLTADGWMVYSHQPFTSQQWLRVTVDGVEHEIAVTDDTVPGVVQGTNGLTFAKDMPAATIQIDNDIIRNPANATFENKTTYIGFTTMNADNLGTYNSAGDGTGIFAVYDPNLVSDYNEKLFAGQDNFFAGDLFSFTYPDAATLPDGSKADVVLTYSNLHIALQESYSGSFDAPVYIASGNLLRAGNGMASGTNNRNGLQVDVNIKVLKNGELVDGTFLYPMTDIDNSRKSQNAFSTLYNADANNNYSEQVSVNSGWVDSIYIPDQYGKDESTALALIGKNPSANPNYGYKCDLEQYYAGARFVGSGNSDADPGTYYSGFITLADNTNGGINITAWSAGNNQHPIRTSLLNGTQAIWHHIKASTTEGGTIQTTANGNLNGKLNDLSSLITPSKDANKDYNSSTSIVPDGKTMVYTMTADQGYEISAIYIGDDTTDNCLTLGDTDYNQIGTLDINNSSSTVLSGDLAEIKINTINGSANWTSLTVSIDDDRTGTLTYDPDQNAYVFTFPDNNHDHRIHVEWQPITSSLTIDKTIINESVARAAGMADQMFDVTVRLSRGDGQSLNGIVYDLPTEFVNWYQSNSYYGGYYGTGYYDNLEAYIRHYHFDSASSTANVEVFTNYSDSTKKWIIETDPATLKKTYTYEDSSSSHTYTHSPLLNGMLGEPQNVTVDENGVVQAISYTLRLGHGDTFTIEGIPYGTVVDVREVQPVPKANRTERISGWEEPRFDHDLVGADNHNYYPYFYPNSNFNAESNRYSLDSTRIAPNRDGHTVYIANEYIEYKPFKIKVQKIWDDNNNADGKRPEYIKVQLYAQQIIYSNQLDTREILVGEPVLLTEPFWSYEWTQDDLRQGTSSYYTPDDYVFYVKEINPVMPDDTPENIKSEYAPLDDYDTIYTRTEPTAELNTYYSLVDRQGNPYISIDIKALPDEYKMLVYPDRVMVDSDGTVDYDGDLMFCLVNKYTPQTTHIEGTKTWDDNNNSDGKRPSAVTLKLHNSDGQLVKDFMVCYDGAQWVLLQSDYSERIEALEDEIESLKTDIETLENTTIPALELQINNASDQATLDSLNEQLAAANQEKADKETLKNKYENILDKYKNDPLFLLQDAIDECDEILNNPTATTEEKQVASYRKEAYLAQRDALTGSEPDYVDQYNGLSEQIAAIEAKLGVYVIVTDDDGDNNNFSFQVNGLTLYDNLGNPINYVISENYVKDYVTTYEGNDITNKYNPEMRTIRVLKVWEGDDAHLDKRPSEVKVRLRAVEVNGVGEILKENYTGDSDIARAGDTPAYIDFPNPNEVNGGTVPELTATLNATSRWLYDFTVRVKDDNGNPIHYIVEESMESPNSDYYYCTVAYGTTYGDPYATGHQIIFDPNKAVVTVDDSNLAVITNHYNLTNVKVQKIWDDDNNRDNQRTDIDVTLHQINTLSTDNPIIAQKDEFGNLTAQNGWSYEWKDQPLAEYTFNYNDPSKPELEEKYEYYVTENVPSGYVQVVPNGSASASPAISPTNTSFTPEELLEQLPQFADQTIEYSNGKLLYLVNHYDTEKAIISGQKIWDHGNNLSEWNAGVILQVFNQRNELVKEFVLGGNEFSINNACDNVLSDPEATPYQKQIAAQLKAENQRLAAMRQLAYTQSAPTLPLNPTASDLAYYQEEKAKYDVYAVYDASDIQFNASNNYEIITLPKYDANGVENFYFVRELPVPNYITSYGDPNGYLITNKYMPEPTERQITVLKTWDDNNNAAGTRPDSVKVTLKAYDPNVTESSLPQQAILNADNSWTYTFTVPDQYQYIVEEDTPAGYTCTVNYGDAPAWTTLPNENGKYTVVAPNGFVVINNKAEETTRVKVQKIWDDDNNRDGKRPAFVNVTLLRAEEGADSFDKFEEYNDQAVLTEANGWTYVWENLPKYYTDGGDQKEYLYIVRETVLSQSEYRQLELINSDAVIYVKNTEDPNYKPLYENIINNNYIQSLPDDYITGATFTVVGDQGSALQPGDGIMYYIVNKYSPETVTLNGAKTWVDDNNRDNARPQTITLRVLGDGVEAAAFEIPTGLDTVDVKAEIGAFIEYYIGPELPKYLMLDYLNDALSRGQISTFTANLITKYLNAFQDWDFIDLTDMQSELCSDSLLSAQANKDADGNITGTGFTYAISGLPKYDHHGQLITYRVVEDYVPGYATTYDGHNIVNTYAPDTRAITVFKSWDDDNNRDGLRPDSVTVTLTWDDDATTINGAEYDKGLSAVLSVANNWQYTFENLPVKRLSAPYQKTIRSYNWRTGQYDEYYLYYDEDGKEVRNDTGVPVMEYNIVYTVRESIEPRANGYGGYYTQSQAITSSNGYSYHDGNTSSSGTKLTEYDTGIIFVNSYTPQTATINVEKKWNDNNNADGRRPDSVPVTLLQNGQPVATAELKDSDNWKYTFSNGDENQYPRVASTVDTPLYVYDRNGNLNNYTVIEGMPKDSSGNLLDCYTPEYARIVNQQNIDYNIYNGIIDYTITNTYTPETTSLTVTKVWQGADGKTLAPNETFAHVTVKLLADGTAAKDGDNDITAVLSQSNGWTYTFTNLPKYKAGNNGAATEIEYSVQEVVSTDEAWTNNFTHNAASDVIKSQDNGWFIINHAKPVEPETVTIKVIKNWDDNGDQDGQRPEELIVRLLKDGEEIDHKELKETTAGGQTSDDPGDEPENPGQQTSDDTGEPEPDNPGDPNNSQSNTNGRRFAPARAAANQATLTTWTNETLWENLPRYAADGHEIVYTVTEDVPAGYEQTNATRTVDGDGNVTVEFTNARHTISINAIKTWMDESDQDGLRPEALTVHLLRDGVEIDHQELAAADSWQNGELWKDLPRYAADGHEIVYTVTETVPNGYEQINATRTVDGDGNVTVEFTNKHIPETREITITKVWDDDDNRDGKRPESIEVSLLVDGSAVYTQTLSDGNQWAYTWKDLPVYKDGQVIEYVAEEAPTNPGELGEYAPSVTGNMDEGFTFTNSYTPERINIDVVKEWGDHNNQDGQRPTTVTVVLYNGNQQVAARTLSAADMDPTDPSDNNTWKYTFEGLLKYENGKEIEYTVRELSVPNGYTDEVSGDINNGFIIFNKYAPATTSLTGRKTWVDDNNQAGKRPTEVTLHVYADNATEAVREFTASLHGELWGLAGNAADNGITVVVNSSPTDNNSFTYSVTGLSKYDNGRPISYRVIEELVPGYTTAYDHNNITNTYAPEKTSVTVLKVWDDSNNQDGLRPESVQVTLWASGNAVARGAITAAEGWKYTFTDLPARDKSGDIHYNVTEDEVVGYITKYGDNAQTVAVPSHGLAVITNTHDYTPATVSVTVEKTWNDNNDQDGLRPEALTLHLLADGVKILTKIESMPTDTSAEVWSNLPRYAADGHEIVYTVEEDTPAAYTLTAITREVDADGNVTVKLTNTHEPLIPVVVTNILVEKEWQDEHGNDIADTSKIPPVVVTLLADGTPVESKIISNNTTVNGVNWRTLFTNQPVKNANNVEIQYTVVEKPVEGYVTTITGEANDTTGFTIINTRIPSTADIVVTKQWQDNNNLYGTRPAAIQVILSKNTDHDWRHVVNLTAANNWMYTFTDLPIYEENGTPIAYTVDEEMRDIVGVYMLWNQPDPIIPYETTSRVYSITLNNLLASEEIIATKTWDDSNNQDGMRPDSTTVRLTGYANDVVVLQRVYTLSVADAASGNEDTWSHTFKGLPVQIGDTTVEYRLTEDAVEGYTAAITHDGRNGYTITNTHEPETRDITVTKVWDDDDNRDGVRPTEVRVALFNGDTQVSNAIVLSGDSWTGTFTDLPKYQAGEVSKIVDYSTYTVKESTDGTNWVEVNNPFNTDYTFTSQEYSADDGFTLTNTHTPKTIPVKVVKYWYDSDNQDGKRPASIEVTLLANGTAVSTQTLSAANETSPNKWESTFTDMLVYENGLPITYSVEESPLAEVGYTVTSSPVTVSDSDEEIQIGITNTYIPETRDITVTKVWDDDDNRDGVRPTSVDVTLKAKANGNDLQPADIYLDGGTATITLPDGNQWAYTWKDLPVYYRDTANNKSYEIEYTVEEEIVPADYTPSVTGNMEDGFTLTNTHEPATTSISGYKIWQDNFDRDGIRPDSVTVYLLADGKIVAEQTVTAPAEDYHVPANIWIRDPSDAVVAIGSNMYSPYVTSVWPYSFDNLPMYKEGGQEIKYTVDENTPTGYDKIIADSAPDNYPSLQGNTFIIINRHHPETINIHVKKVWDDDDNPGKRPDSVAVYLVMDNRYIPYVKNEYRDGTKDDWYTSSASLVLTAENNWEGMFANWPVYEQGRRIEYSVVEAMDHYPHEANSLTNEGCAPDLTGKSTWQLMRADWTRPLSGLPNGWFASMKFFNEANYPDYTINYSGDAEHGFVITNTYTPETISLTVVKNWDDGNNADGLRPDFVTVSLFANGTLLDKVNLNVANSWRYEWHDLLKNKKEELGGIYPIKYTVVETPIDGYDSSFAPSNEVEGADGIVTITNTHELATRDITVTKEWENTTNTQNVTIRLLADGQEVDNQVLPAGDSTVTFSDKQKYINGREIVYTVTEDALEHFNTVIAGNAGGGFTITNIFAPGETSVTVTKVWQDAYHCCDNYDGLRPDAVEVRLLQDSNEYDTVTLTAGSNWTYTWTGLPIQDGSGNNYTYTVEEVTTVPGYNLDANGDEQFGTVAGDAKAGFTIVNTHEVKFARYRVSKVWDDDNNRDGKRPDFVTVVLYELNYDNPGLDSEVPNGSVTLSEANGWTHLYEGLPLRDEKGRHITYYAQELGVLNGNVVSLGAPDCKLDNGYTYVDTDRANNLSDVFTNKYEPETITVAGVKTWEDNGDQDGKRPDNITIKLYADGELKAQQTIGKNEQDFSFENLPKYDSGRLIQYHVVEDAVPGYTTTYDGFNIKNTYTPNKLSVTVLKKWDDGNNQDGLRPDTVTVTLTKDGTPVAKANLSAANSWMYTFTDLDVGSNYTVVEDAVNGYTNSVDGDAETGFIITNKHERAKTSVEVSKNWVDDVEANRPASVTVNLLADGLVMNSTALTAAEGWTYTWSDLPKYQNGQEIIYTVSETAVDGYASTYDRAVADGKTTVTLTNTLLAAPEQTISVTVSKVWKDCFNCQANYECLRPATVQVQLMKDSAAEGTPVVLSAANNWTYTWNDLAAGAYEVEEVNVPEGYNATVLGNAKDGFTIVNEHKVETIDVNVTKEWAPDTAEHPASVTVTLLADGTPMESKVLTEGSDWEATFTNLVKNRKGTKTPITYTVLESPVEGFVAVVNRVSETDFTITNKPVEKTAVTVTKVWDDANNQDGKRPAYVNVQLLRDGVAYGSVVTITEGMGWTYTFENLPKTATNGAAYAYEVQEQDVANGYALDSISGNAEKGYTITNAYTPETITVAGVKTWEDNNNQEKQRPASITVRLYADGAPVNDKVAIIKSTDEQKFSFDDLPKYDNGRLIQYRVVEDPVANYTTTYDGYNIINRYAPSGATAPATRSVTVSKVWIDQNNQDGLRPDSATVTLTGTAAAASSGAAAPMGVAAMNVAAASATSGTITRTAVLNDANGWNYTFTDLPVKDSNGNPYTYVVDEAFVPAYYTKDETTGDQDSGFLIINRHTPETTKVSVTKSWDNDLRGERPVITVRLYGNGQQVGIITMPVSNTGTLAADYSYTFTDLPKYSGGKLITYTVTEDALLNYTPIIIETHPGEFEIRNPYEPGKIGVSVSKVWKDSYNGIENYAGQRPDSVAVQLKNGTDTVAEATLSAVNNWTYTWYVDAKDTSGNAIAYTVEETEPAGYTCAISGDMTSGFTLVNTLTTAETSITVNKAWKDSAGNDKLYGLPRSVTVTLLADGTPMQSKVLTADTGWTATFTNLPLKNAAGSGIAYTVLESPVEGYSSKAEGNAKDGFTITNTEVELMTLSVLKKWEDGNNRDQVRPAYVNVVLQQNGRDYGRIVTLSEANGWAYTWEGVPNLDADGKPYTYAVREFDVYSYTPDANPAPIDLTTRSVVITNTYTPEKTRVTGMKTWVDDDNRDQLRPDTVAINLMGNGEFAKLVAKYDGSQWMLDQSPDATLGANAITMSVEHVDDNHFIYTFDGLPRYHNDQLITYTVTENAVDGYTISYDGYNITNTYVPQVRTIHVVKYWEDNADRAGQRPDSIIATLKGEAGGSSVVQKNAVLTSANGWTTSFEGVPVKAEGQDIVYTVSEKMLANSSDYELDQTVEVPVDGDLAIIGNTFKAETVNVTVEKVWDDDDNRDGLRPQNGLKINLMRNGVLVDTKALGNDNTVTFSALEKYEDNRLISYTVEEHPVKGYEAAMQYEIAGGNLKATITNSYTPEKVDVTVTKVWDDANNQDGVRPVAVTVQLLANGKEVQQAAMVGDKTANIWTYTFKDMFKNENGIEITYTAAETGLSDAYTASAEGLTITNKHTPETVDITVAKVWEDGNNADRIRPSGVQVQLFANGLKSGDPVTLNEAGGWTYQFTGLAKRAGGVEITYTVEETPVNGYTAAITGSAASGFTITNKHKVTPYVPDNDPTTPPVSTTVPPADATPTITPSATASTVTPTLVPTATPAPTPVGFTEKMSFTKEWVGEVGEMVNHTVYYPDGSIRHNRFDRQQFISDNEWLYEAWFQDAGVYYVIEDPTPGYMTVYQNIGEYADVTDRCYNGGKIINYRIPKTGDTFRPELWLALAGAALIGLGVTVTVRSKKRRNRA